MTVTRSVTHPGYRLHAPRLPERMPQIKLTSTALGVDARSRFAFDGVVAEHIQVGGTEGFAFSWVGEAHCVALHNLQLNDGEIFGDGLISRRPRDLRGRLTFVPSLCRSWGWYRPRAAGQSITALYFNPSDMSEDFGETFVQVPKRLHVHFLNPYLGGTMGRLQSALSRIPAVEAMYLESLCIVALFELCSLYRENRVALQRPPGTLARRRQQLVTDYIEDHLDRDISLDELAAVASLSRYHFVRVFKQTMHVTPYQYLIRRRIARAELLLRKESITVEYVAEAVGFKDTTRFIRTFRRLKGITPGVYRAA